MIHQNEINTAKRVSIVHYLESLGHFPNRTATDGQYVYCSPLSNEKTASFYVRPAENVFYDFSSGEKGDSIRLVQALQGYAFHQAVQHLLTLSQTLETDTLFPPPSLLSLSGQSIPISVSLHKIKRLENNALVRYVESRCISYVRAVNYVQEVYYSSRGHTKSLFALAFQNDKAGYELRSQERQFTVGQKAIRTITASGSKQVNLFEGFFDFLSALEYYKVYQPNHTTIILNSLSLQSEVEKLLPTYQWVNVYFDRDKAGMKVLADLQAKFTHIRDCSKVYEGYKDFNEMLCKKPI